MPHKCALQFGAENVKISPLALYEYEPSDAKRNRFGPPPENIKQVNAYCQSRFRQL